MIKNTLCKFRGIAFWGLDPSNGRIVRKAYEKNLITVPCSSNLSQEDLYRVIYSLNEYKPQQVMN